MAEREDIARLGIKRTEDCAFDIYTGTADALIAAGLIHAEQLPGGAGVNKMMRTFRPEGGEIRKGESSRYVPGARRIVKRGGKFAVEVTVDFPERDRRMAEWDARREAEREQIDMAKQARDAGMTVEQWLLRDVPTSAEQFRENACGFAEALLESVERRMFGRFGYSFDATVRAQCEALTGAIMRLFEGGRIVFDKAAHEQAIGKALASGGIVRQAERPKPTLRVVKS